MNILFFDHLQRNQSPDAGNRISDPRPNMLVICHDVPDDELELFDVHAGNYCSPVDSQHGVLEYDYNYCWRVYYNISNLDYDDALDLTTTATFC